MQNEYNIRQPGTTKEEWEGGFIRPSSAHVVPRVKGDGEVASRSEVPPRFSIELTPEELWQLGECAYEQGLTMPGVVRRLVLEELARRNLEKEGGGDEVA